MIGIEVKLRHLVKAYGRSYWKGGVPRIDLPLNIDGPELLISAWHEVCHLLYHPAEKAPFTRYGNLWNWSKCDRQAEIIGVMAWMPHGPADLMTPDELMKEFGVRREVAEFRASLNLWR